MFFKCITHLTKITSNRYAGLQPGVKKINATYVTTDAQTNKDDNRGTTLERLVKKKKKKKEPTLMGKEEGRKNFPTDRYMAVLLFQFFFVRAWFHLWRLFCHFLFLVSPSLGALERLFFVVALIFTGAKPRPLRKHAYSNI